MAFGRRRRGDKDERGRGGGGTRNNHHVRVHWVENGTANAQVCFTALAAQDLRSRILARGVDPKTIRTERLS